MKKHKNWRKSNESNENPPNRVSSQLGLTWGGLRLVARPGSQNGPCTCQGSKWRLQAIYEGILIRFLDASHFGAIRRMRARVPDECSVIWGGLRLVARPGSQNGPCTCQGSKWRLQAIYEGILIRFLDASHFGAIRRLRSRVPDNCFRHLLLQSVWFCMIVLVLAPTALDWLIN